MIVEWANVALGRELIIADFPGVYDGHEAEAFLTTLPKSRRSKTDHEASGRLGGERMEGRPFPFSGLPNASCAGKGSNLALESHGDRSHRPTIEEHDQPTEILRATFLLARFDSASQVERAAIDGAVSGGRR